MWNREEPQSPLDTGMIVFGSFVGLVIGAIITLLTAPKTGRDVGEEITTTIRTQINDRKPIDPVVSSIDEGKAAARRRREMQGG